MLINEIWFGDCFLASFFLSILECKSSRAFFARCHFGGHLLIFSFSSLQLISMFIIVIWAPKQPNQMPLKTLTCVPFSVPNRCATVLWLKTHSPASLLIVVSSVVFSRRPCQFIALLTQLLLIFPFNFRPCIKMQKSSSLYCYPKNGLEHHWAKSIVEMRALSRAISLMRLGKRHFNGIIASKLKLNELSNFEWHWNRRRAAQLAFGSGEIMNFKWKRAHCEWWC